jgi:hypothetical protein
LVLNSSEQLAAAMARLQLRQGQGEMKKAINAAKKDLRATERALTRHIKKAEKGMSETRKAMEKGGKASRKAKEAVPCGTRSARMLNLLVTEKAATAAQKA